MVKGREKDQKTLLQQQATETPHQFKMFPLSRSLRRLKPSSRCNGSHLRRWSDSSRGFGVDSDKKNKSTCCLCVCLAPRLVSAASFYLSCFICTSSSSRRRRRRSSAVVYLNEILDVCVSVSVWINKLIVNNGIIINSMPMSIPYTEV